MNYATPAAFRVALDTRLANSSRETGIDLTRLRRRVVFERLLVRLEAEQQGRWVLKGGMALEVRWPERARSTRDLDLAVTTANGLHQVQQIRELLGEALANDPQEDWFQFVLGSPQALSADDEGRPGWRIPIEAQLAGRQFAKVFVDIVARPEEMEGTERLILPGTLAFAGVLPIEIEVINRNQHFAEKLHALTRLFAGRPNTRVKDLPDLILLIGDGLPPSRDLLAAVRHVFASRGMHDAPTHLPDPPADWAPRYTELTAELNVTARTIDRAMEELRRFWTAVLSTEET